LSISDSFGTIPSGLSCCGKKLLDALAKLCGWVPESKLAAPEDPEFVGAVDEDAATCRGAGAGELLSGGSDSPAVGAAGFLVAEEADATALGGVTPEGAIGVGPTSRDGTDSKRGAGVGEVAVGSGRRAIC